MDLDAMERDAGAASRLATGMRSSHINFWTLGDCDLVASLAEHVTALVAEVKRLRAERPSSMSELRARLSAEWLARIDRIEADGFVDPPPVVVTETDSCPLG